MNDDDGGLPRVVGVETSARRRTPAVFRVVVVTAANDPLVVVVVIIIVVVGIVFIARVNECGMELERAVQT